MLSRLFATAELRFLAISGLFLSHWSREQHFCTGPHTGHGKQVPFKHTSYQDVCTVPPHRGVYCTSYAVYGMSLPPSTTGTVGTIRLPHRVPFRMAHLAWESLLYHGRGTTAMDAGRRTLPRARQRSMWTGCDWSSGKFLWFLFSFWSYFFLLYIS